MTREADVAGRPLVSVVTVVYNGAAHIEETIRAVAAQTYPEIRHIVVDGGSTDGTVEILRRLEDRLDCWVSEPDRGVYDAMNKGIGLVSDPRSYVLFANAGDALYAPDVIERAMNAAAAGGADLVYGRMAFSDGAYSGVMGRPVQLSDLARETLCHPATFVRREVFDRVGLFDTSYRLAADYDHIVRCFCHPVSTQFVDVIVSRMRMGGLSGDDYMLSCSERKRVVRSRFGFFRRLAGVTQINLYDIPRNVARHLLQRAGLLERWRLLKGS